MAALLRSARLLKFSPSGLLQITGTKRTGPPLGRLYSGAVSGRRAGVCSRQISPVCENASSHCWPYAAGCVRNYVVATEHRDEGSTALRSKQAQQFDWALTKLDNSVRKTGRVTKTLLYRIFQDVIRAGYPSSNQALLLLRSCGSLLPEVVLEERTELAHHVWDKLQELGTQYDVSHYNALLKVYLQNEFKFSPTDFLAKMEAAKVQPNRVTYQRLIAAYCQTGDIEGASTILGFMKSKDLPITEAVFSSLVTGHARAGDIESAKNILPVMKGAGIEPTPDTYVSLLIAYAEKGDIGNLRATLEAAENADCGLMDRDIMQVISALAKAGHQQHIPEMIERLRHERGFIPDAMNLCLGLVTQGQEDAAFLILMTFPNMQQQQDTFTDPNMGNFFLRHCVNIDIPVEKIVRYSKELQESNLHSAPLSFALFCALEAKKTGPALELMKICKEQNLPIRAHYSWPLLIHHRKENNTAGVVEVMKAMQDLGVPADVETLSNHVIPVFPSREAARQALKNGGVLLESDGFLISELRLLISMNLAEAYTLMSDPSFPSVDFSNFRGSLIAAFRKSDDVETMVKITQLLYKDERFSKEDITPAESTGFFLYSLMDSLGETQMQAQVDKLRSFFNQLHAQNINISKNLYRGIKNVLWSYQTPDLMKDVFALVDPAERISADTETSSPPHLRATDVGAKLGSLEHKLSEMKAENKPFKVLLKQIIQTLSVDEQLERALELKKEYQQHMTVGSYAVLINMCCRHDNVDEALNLKRELSRMDSSITLDTSKYIALVKALAMNNRVEEAVDILKEMKEKNVVMNDNNVTSIFHLLNNVAGKAGISSAHQLQETIFTLGLVKPSANLCSPVVNAYLESGDLPGALEAALDCQKRYKHLPRMHDIIVGLVEKGDTDLLQKAMDFVSQERGEMIMLYDLFFAFLHTGRYREARKIIETPGLRAKPGRLQWYAEKCIANNQMEALEQMVDMTSKLFECDRDDMYNYVLRLCKNTNDWQKAEATWTKMQEENVIPRERTLLLLADILKSNGQEVPFEVPETWYEDDHTTQQVKPAEEAAAAAAESSESAPSTFKNDNEYHTYLLALCKRGKAKGAYKMLKEADKMGVVVGLTHYDHVIRALLAEGSIEEAMALKEIAQSHVPSFQLSDVANNLLIITYSKTGKVKAALEELKSAFQLDHVPSLLAITRLVQALGSHGDVAGIQEVESLIQSLGTNLNLSSMVFINNTALAHIKNGDIDSAVELLDGLYTNPDTSNNSMSFVFRKVLESGNDHALDKLSAMAERLANHFACYRPASDLFLQLLDMDMIEDAKFMLARCNAVAEQKTILLSYVARKAQMPGQVNKIKNLVGLIPDITEKPILYSYLLKCHVVDKDLKSAKALHEQMQKEGIVVHELSLKRLAGLYRDAGETAPFPEPPETFKFYADKLKAEAAKAQPTAEE